MPMNPQYLGACSFLLEAAVFIAFLTHSLEDPEIKGKAMGPKEKAGLIGVTMVVLSPLLIFDLGVLSLTGMILATSTIVLTVLTGTGIWWKARRRVQGRNRPVLESYMLSLNDVGIIPGPEGTSLVKGPIWVYACNTGHGAARSLRIDTNIPDELVQTEIWEHGMMSRGIESLDPDLPVCIGVLRSEASKEEPYWISFRYEGNDRTCYVDRYELEM